MNEQEILRAHMASRLLQGILASHSFNPRVPVDVKRAAVDWAVEYADLMLERLKDPPSC